MCAGDDIPSVRIRDDSHNSIVDSKLVLTGTSKTRELRGNCSRLDCKDATGEAV